MRVCAEVFAILLLQAILPSVLAGCKETTPWHDDDDATGAKVLDRISDDVKSQFDAFTGKSGKSMRNICVYIKTGELKEDIDSSERFSNKADSEGRLEEASQLLLTDYIHREITAVDFGFLKPSKGSYDEGPAHNPHLSRLEVLRFIGGGSIFALPFVGLNLDMDAFPSLFCRVRRCITLRVCLKSFSEVAMAQFAWSSLRRSAMSNGR